MTGSKFGLRNMGPSLNKVTSYGLYQRNMVSISKNGCKAPKTEFFKILCVNIWRGQKWGWAWSERFENQNKRNALIRFMLKKLLQYLKCVFRHFTCIRNRPKMGVAGATVSRWSWAMNFFCGFSRPKGKIWWSLGPIGDKK